jgi:hypothetical protein
MFGSVLEVAIGVVFVFLLASIICSAVREGIEAFLKTRAAFLERGIRELLHDREATGLAKQVYTHPLVAGMYRNEYEPSDHTKHRWPLARGRDLPAYIPSRNFALALLDVAARGPIDDSNPARSAQAPALSLAAVKSNLANFPAPLQRVLLTAIDVAEGDLNAARAMLEHWYDDAMDRVSSWYKRSTQMILFIIGLVFAVVVNVDTIAITRHLSHDSAAREAIVARAQAAVADTAYLSRSYTQAKADLEQLKLPIGWDVVLVANRPWYSRVLGWFITALAVTMGAPFWFDLLNKVTAVRSAVKPTPKPPPPPPDDASVVVAAGGGRAAAVVTGGAATTAIVAGAPHAHAEEHIDACDITVTSETPDDQLPPAEGGVLT